MAMRLWGWTLLSLSLASLLTAQSEVTNNSNERILRIRDLGKRNFTALPLLTGYLTDSNPDVRIEAVKAIVKIDTEHSLDPLIVATRDKDQEVEIRATDGIVNVYLPGYVAKGGLTGSMTRGLRQVKTFFSARNDQTVSADVRVRSDAAQAIAALITDGATTEARANAALAAGILRDKAALPALLASLHAKDSDLLFECLVALQKIHQPITGQSLGFLAQDLDARVQLTALETIGVLRDVSAAPEVRSALTGARSIKVKRAALQALAMLGQTQDRTTFLQYSSDRDAALRAIALEGLGRIREPQDFPVLQTSFDEGEIDWRIHLAAAFGMVNEGKVDTSEFSPLAYLVEGLQTKVRYSTAVAYLTELSAQESVVAALSKMIPTLDKGQKIALCSIFAASGNPNVVQPLTILSKDADTDVAFAASKALQITQTREAS